MRPRHDIDLGVSLSLSYRLEEREKLQSLKEGGLGLSRECIEKIKAVCKREESYSLVVKWEAAAEEMLG